MCESMCASCHRTSRYGTDRHGKGLARRSPHAATPCTIQLLALLDVLADPAGRQCSCTKPLCLIGIGIVRSSDATEHADGSAQRRRGLPLSVLVSRTPRYSALGDVRVRVGKRMARMTHDDMGTLRRWQR